MIPDALIALLAAFVGGSMNAISGGGTFVTYPVLLALGTSSVVANTTSTIGLWPGIFTSLFGYKKELRAVRKQIKLFIPPALLGGIAGSFILTHTSNSAFSLIAPVLIIIGALLLWFQNAINRSFNRIDFGATWHRHLFVFLLVAGLAVYGSYFGAGVGILLLGVLSLLGMTDLYKTIALKNVISLIINLVAVIYFIATRFVHWDLVPFMAIGSMAGGIFGSHIAHRVNRRVVRIYTIMLGFAIAGILFYTRLR
jgi:uncharacterized membrane protein YfcA